MLNIIWVVALVLLGLWVLGLATSFTMGGAIHVLLILAIIAVVFQLIAGRRAG